MSLLKKLACILAVSLSAMLGPLDMASGSPELIYPWSTKAPMPTTRSLFSLSVVNGKLYAIGGSRNAYISTGVMEVYDPATNTWSGKGDTPEVGCGQATCVLNDRIYIFGGQATVEGAITSAAYEYNPATDTWTKKADMPTPRSVMSAGAVDGKIYVIGGAIEHVASAFKTVEVYDPATDTWQKKADMPTARFGHAVSVVDGKIYVFGGARDVSLDSLTVVEAYDPATDKWTAKTDMPIPVFGLSSAVVAGKVYTLGGGNRYTEMYRSVAEYDPVSNSWRARSPMLSGRGGLSAGVVAGKIYAVGGMNTSAVRLSTMEEYVPAVEPTGVTYVDFIPGAGGAVTFSTVESDEGTRGGYADVVLSEGAVPYATAVFSFKQSGVTVTEAGVPASPPTKSARVFVDYRSAVPAVPGRKESGVIDINTGIAIVNQEATAANVTYSLRSISGALLSNGQGIVAAGAHYAKFINQLQDVASGFSLPPDFALTTQLASLEIVSDQPLSVLALRLTTNQRNEALLTTTPTADLTRPLTKSPVYFPQLADGGGYTTAFLLLNTSSQTETGTLQILDDKGSPLVVNQVGGTADSTFKYSIPAGGAFRFQTDGSPAVTKAGWAQLIPDPGTSTPVGSGVFSYSNKNILVTESGVPGIVSTKHARVYVDLSAGHNTGLALAVPGNSEAGITLAAYQLDGATSIGTSQGTLRLPANGYVAKFASELISDLPAGFTGVLDISSTTPFAALTLRSLNNQRNDFLLTTFPVADMNQTAPSPIVFPQIADGGGYATQFILLSTGKAAGMMLNFYGEDGKRLGVGK